MGESVDDASADSESGKRTGAGHKGDFGDVLPGFTIFGEFVLDKLKKFFGEVAGESISVFLVV